MALRVVWGVGEVMETFDSQIVLSSVDLPEEGLPMIATDAHFMMQVYMFCTSVSNALSTKKAGDNLGKCKE